MNLQISLGKTNALESHKSGISMGKEWIGLTKDHEKVKSLVATKEHVTLRHAWHESKKRLWEKIVKKCSDIFARLRGFINFFPISSEAPWPSEDIGAFFHNFFSQPFFRFMPGMAEGHVLLRCDQWRHFPMILCETYPFLSHRNSRLGRLKSVSLSKANLQIHFQGVG